MADAEVSKIMWIAIVVALAAIIFVVAKPQIHDLAEGVFKKVEEVVTGIDTKGTVTPDGGFITGFFG